MHGRARLAPLRVGADVGRGEDRLRAGLQRATAIASFTTSPRRTTRPAPRPRNAPSRSCSDSSMNVEPVRRGVPGRRAAASSSTNSGTTCSASRAARASAGWSWTRRSRLKSTTAVRMRDVRGAAGFRSREGDLEDHHRERSPGSTADGPEDRARQPRLHLAADPAASPAALRPRRVRASEHDCRPGEPERGPRDPAGRSSPAISMTIAPSVTSIASPTSRFIGRASVVTRR